MKLIELTKSKFFTRITLNCISILFAVIMISFLGFQETFFIYPIPIIIIINIIYLIRDISFFLRKKRLLTIESKSQSILWITLISLTAIFILLMNPDLTMWIYLMILMMLNGLLIEYRRKVLLIDDNSMEKIDFPWSTKIDWKDIYEVTENERILTIQAKNKNYVCVDLNKSSAKEKENLNILIKEKYSAQQAVL